ncbi:hypothetical protein Acsp05_08380 [Actinokineospora sp. NBRC 105648]|nr:hypothetical protein Acsp05_08380 [Actinokineospora sp. NBRC 105648]
MWGESTAKLAVGGDALTLPFSLHRGALGAPHEASSLDRALLVNRAAHVYALPGAYVLPVERDPPGALNPLRQLSLRPAGLCQGGKEYLDKDPQAVFWLRMECRGRVGLGGGFVVPERIGGALGRVFVVNGGGLRGCFLGVGCEVVFSVDWRRGVVVG